MARVSLMQRDLNWIELLKLRVQNLAADPSSPQPGWVFFHTGEDALKIRNAANDAWISLSAGAPLDAEQVQDIVGAMFTGNTETGIAATYEDADGTIDLVVDFTTANTYADNAVAAHTGDATDAHDASAVSYAGGTGISATDVEGALDELATEKANASDLTDHINDTTAAHAASAISYAGGTGMSATDVEAAIDELATEKENASNKGQANGYASLDGNGLVPAAQMPPLAISEFLGTVASQAAMLALTGQRGDWAKRSDTGETFILKTDDPTLIANWEVVTGPADGVTAVTGTAPITSSGGATPAIGLNIGTGLESDGTNLRIAAAAAGDGLTGGAGSALAVGAGAGVAVTADAVAVVRTDGNGRVPLKYAANVGDGAATTFNIDHNLNSLDVIVQIYRVSDGVEVECDVTRSTVNRVILGFAAAPTSNQYRVVVYG